MIKIVRVKCMLILQVIEINVECGRVNVTTQEFDTCKINTVIRTICHIEESEYKLNVNVTTAFILTIGITVQVTNRLICFSRNFPSKRGY